MPQKRNPDSLELIRSKSNIIRNQNSSLLNVLSNLPLTYFKDFQEDKKMIFDSYDDLKLCIDVMTAVLRESSFKSANGLKICEDNFASATDLADYLVIEKEISFRDSYKIIAEIVDYAKTKEKTMSQLSLEEFKIFNKKIDKNIFKYIDIKNSINRKKTNMSTNPFKVNRAIKKALIFIKK